VGRAGVDLGMYDFFLAVSLMNFALAFFVWLGDLIQMRKDEE